MSRTPLYEMTQEQFAEQGLALVNTFLADQAARSGDSKAPDNVEDVYDMLAQVDTLPSQQTCG